MVFSASLQETLGIGLFEGLLCGAAPFAPARLSYLEMYEPEYLYPSEWTENLAAYYANRPALVARLRQALDQSDHQRTSGELAEMAQRIQRDFFTATPLHRAVCGTPGPS
jgi:hypothetical protein